MNVQHPHGDADGQRDEYHGEEKVLSQKGHGQGRRGDDLGQQQEEDSQRQQDGDAEGNLEKGKFKKMYWSSSAVLPNCLARKYTDCIRVCGDLRHLSSASCFSKCQDFVCQLTN